MGKGKLILCGLDIGRPFDLSLRTITALKGADIIFVQGPSEEVVQSIRSLGPDVRSVPGSTDIWSRMRREISRGRRAAYLSFGHPLFFTSGRDLAQRSAREGFDVSVVPCPSAVDHLIALLWNKPAWFASGFLVRGAPRLARAKDSFIPEVTTIVYYSHDLIAEGTLPDFQRRLREAYPARHRFYGIECANGGNKDLIRAFSVGEKSFKSKLTPSMSLVIPAVSRQN